MPATFLRVPFSDTRLSVSCRFRPLPASGCFGLVVPRQKRVRLSDDLPTGGFAGFGARRGEKFAGGLSRDFQKNRLGSS